MMDLSEFKIGLEFWCSGNRYRCTDVGTRVAVAIRVDQAEIGTRHEDGTITHHTISGEEADRIGWFDGPHYAVVETVFDEDDREICTLTEDEEP